MFGVVSQITGHSRLSIVSLIIFFLLGIYILTRVNVDEGIRVAIADENELKTI
jgi:UMF1 family MFS transporter